MITNQHHHQIILELDILAGNTDIKERQWVQRYLGSDKPTRCIKTGELQKLAKKYPADIKLIGSLYHHGITFDELVVAANLVLRCSDLKLIHLDDWLNHTVGWAEVDTLCQSNFPATILLSSWSSWQIFLTKLSKDKNINRRRASLVLLCKSLRQSDDPRLLSQALTTVTTLTLAKEVLITKAISWVLRSAIKNHSEIIKIFLEENKSTLPKIAYRETLKKLTTGKKS